jgi:hypothetical protein
LASACDKTDNVAFNLMLTAGFDSITKDFVDQSIR